VYFGIFQRTRKRQDGRKTEAGEQGGRSPFPSYPSLPNHTGSKHIGGRETHSLPPREENAQSYTHAHIQIRPHPSTPGAGQGYTEKQSTVDSRGRGSNKVSLQTGIGPTPVPFLLYPQSLTKCSSTLLGHCPMASSFFPAAGDKKKKGTEQGAKVHPSAPVPHVRWSVPCPQW
jgi:hypothetical protein